MNSEVQVINVALRHMGTRLGSSNQQDQVKMRCFHFPVLSADMLSGPGGQNDDVWCCLHKHATMQAMALAYISYLYA